MSYKKTAKDLAFDREKAQLQKKIRQLNEFIGGQEKIIRGLTEAVEARDAEIRVKVAGLCQPQREGCQAVAGGCQAPEGAGRVHEDFQQCRQLFLK